MKKVKQICAFIVVASLFISCAYAETVKVTPRAWLQLAETTYSFDLDDNGKVTAVGTTTGCGDSTKVTVAVYVERQKTGGWSTVPGMSWTASSTTDTYVSIDKVRWVDKGYSYRLRVEHSATGPRGTETATSYSSAYYYG